jgi:hypothetical protein
MDDTQNIFKSFDLHTSLLCCRPSLESPITYTSLFQPLWQLRPCDSLECWTDLESYHVIPLLSSLELPSGLVVWIFAVGNRFASWNPQLW